MDGKFAPVKSNKLRVEEKRCILEPSERVKSSLVSPNIANNGPPIVAHLRHFFLLRPLSDFPISPPINPLISRISLKTYSTLDNNGPQKLYFWVGKLAACVKKPKNSWHSSARSTYSPFFQSMIYPLSNSFFFCALPPFNAWF